MRVGEWVHCDDGYWGLRLWQPFRIQHTLTPAQRAAVKEAADTLLAIVRQHWDWDETAGSIADHALVTLRAAFPDLNDLDTPQGPP